MRAQKWTLLPLWSFLVCTWGKKSLFNKVLEQLDFHMWRMNLDPYPTPHAKITTITSQWIIDLNGRAKTIKIEENIISLHDIKKWFVVYDFIRINLLFSPQNGRRYLQNYIPVRNLNPEYIKNSEQLSNKKKNNPILNVARTFQWSSG